MAVNYSRRKFIATTGILAATGLAGCTGGNQGSNPTDTSTKSPTSTPAASIDDAKQALSKYQDLSKALAEGYRSTFEFVASPKGSMGIHFVNQQLMKQKPNPAKPPILVYDLTDKGQYELMGAEWFVPAKAVDSTPQMFGQNFNGPMEGHGPGQPKHYDLHAWIFKDNPEGTFAEFNPDVSPPSFMEDISKAREALQPYTDVQKAKDAGYQQTGECVEEKPGGMGFHYVNQDIKGVNPEKPPILMYQKASDGSMQLLGAEWFVPANAVDQTPKLFGQEFNGPMEGHGPDQPRHYDLHTWIFQSNPKGMFTPFNPTVTC